MGMARGEMRDDRGTGGAGGPVDASAISVSNAYLAYAADLRLFLGRIMRDPVSAEDLVQETFVRLVTESAAGRTPAHLRPWLYRVASNLAASRGRRLGVAVRRAPELVARGWLRSAEDDVLEREAADALRGRLADLPPHVRLALLLTAEGFTGAEVAARIGRSELATRSLLCRYRSRLRAATAA